MIKRLVNFALLSRDRRRLFFTAVGLLRQTHRRLKREPFADLLQEYLATLQNADTNAAQADCPMTAGQIFWAVRRARLLCPGALCLPQALTALKMLRSHGLPGELVLGVAHDPDNPQKVEAHAWIEHNGAIVYGRVEGHERYQPFPSLEEAMTQFGDAKQPPFRASAGVFPPSNQVQSGKQG